MNVSFRERKTSNGIQLDIQVKKVVSLKIDRTIAKKLDDNYIKEGFANRSDYIRFLIMKYLEKPMEPKEKVDYKQLLTKNCDVTVTFKLESAYIEKIDEMAKKCGFFNRSDFLRYVLYTSIRFLPLFLLSFLL